MPIEPIRRRLTTFLRLGIPALPRHSAIGKAKRF
jgi:hypothetical protein